MSFFSCEIGQLLNHVCSCFGSEVNYICNLGKNLDALDKAMKVLRARRADVLTDVQRKESEGLQRLNEVQEWLTSVEDIQNKVYELLLPSTDELDRLCLCGLCTKHLAKSHIYGKSVFEMLEEVEDLKSGGVFERVARRPTVAVVVERPLQSNIVGQEDIFEKAWNHLMDKGTEKMGLYGMGGVGKTTLLERINNKFKFANDGFEIVIWVVVSSNLLIEKIQDEIAEKLGFPREEWKKKEKTEKVTDIHTRLKNKKFVLLLDDIWEEVDLKEIGVPSPTRENGCKVVFTTRSTDVCGQMGVDDPMEVKCLESDEAWDLFREIVGRITLESHPEILELACEVARKCRGLPLALNIIGKNMACKRTVQEWDEAIDTLASSAADFRGMKDHIFPILKYSYDGLREDLPVKSCFQYCALFPEDFSIKKEKLVDYWIGERFIDEKQGLKRAKNKAHGIIGTLVQACLLTEENKAHRFLEKTSCVKMHDVVREMALWIANDFGKNKERCIVQIGVGLREVPKVKNWRLVRRMSLINNEIENVSDTPECPELTTLLFQKNLMMKNISGEFFKSMPSLVVLDLSYNGLLNGLPEEISELVSLRYLHLSLTGIRRLPGGLLKLKKLIYLNLERTIESISGISKLSSLRTLRLVDSRVLQDLNGMKELELLEHLEVVTVSIWSILDADQLFKCSFCYQTSSECYSGAIY
ncbi:unnamed protein product [Microthlaspi erraticum]|uniref:Uncharacterized protein n=1 Tax=Microthlaspi erraticum TaxID=1685480 RepID=A0A6D2IN53_9BRAS|nr:unnamed protein product [Microthlaspi erraticum]